MKRKIATKFISEYFSFLLFPRRKKRANTCDAGTKSQPNTYCFSKMVWKSDFFSVDWVGKMVAPIRNVCRYFGRPKWKSNQYFISNFFKHHIECITMYQNKSNALHESQSDLHCTLPVESLAHHFLLNSDSFAKPYKSFHRSWRKSICL